MEGNVLLIKMAEMGVVEDSKLLKTTLGSCVGVILREGKRTISGMAHIMLPEQRGKDSAVGKYADTAIPTLMSRVLKRGGKKEHIQAFVTGGANMFESSCDTTISTVGEKNIQAVKRILAELGIPIVFEETGGAQGRTVLFDNHSGNIEVKTIGTAVWKGEGK
jgi:chemotaxis protein CheD